MSSIVDSVLRFCRQLLGWILDPLGMLLWLGDRDEPPVEDIRAEAGQHPTRARTTPNQAPTLNSDV